VIPTPVILTLLQLFFCAVAILIVVCAPEDGR